MSATETAKVYVALAMFIAGLLITGLVDVPLGALIGIPGLLYLIIAAEEYNKNNEE